MIFNTGTFEQAVKEQACGMEEFLAGEPLAPDFLMIFALSSSERTSAHLLSLIAKFHGTVPTEKSMFMLIWCFERLEGKMAAGTGTVGLKALKGATPDLLNDLRTNYKPLVHHLKSLGPQATWKIVKTQDVARVVVRAGAMGEMFI